MECEADSEILYLKNDWEIRNAEDLSKKNIKFWFADSYRKPIWKLKCSREFVAMNLREF
jgi:hypothetical protein